MKEIDWEHWLCHHHLRKCDVALLTLNLNPEQFGLIYYPEKDLPFLTAVWKCRFIDGYDWDISNQEEFEKQLAYIENNKFNDVYPYAYDSDDLDEVNFPMFLNWAINHPFFKCSETLKNMWLSKSKTEHIPIAKERNQNLDDEYFRYKMPEQEEVILKIIEDLGYDPLKITPYSPSQKTLHCKGQVKKKALENKHLFKNDKVFNDAWQRLLTQGKIANKVST